MAPFQADARTAYFGKGSKASAFYFGTSVGVHTCDGSKGDPKQSVLMMTIDGEKMEERTKAGNCVDTYAPGPPYSTCGLRVPASCVLPAAGGAGQHAGGCTYFYACQPRAYRTTAYCGTTGGKGRVGTGTSLPRQDRGGPEEGAFFSAVAQSRLQPGCLLALLFWQMCFVFYSICSIL